MASREGNVVVAPGFYVGESYTPIEIMASMVGLYQKGCTLRPGQGVLEAGTILVRAADGLYDKAAEGIGAGSAEDAQGVLRLSVDTGADGTAQPKLGNIVRGGILKRAPLVAANSEAVVAATVTALNGSEITDNPADPNHYIVKF